MLCLRSERRHLFSTATTRIALLALLAAGGAMGCRRDPASHGAADSALASAAVPSAGIATAPTAASDSLAPLAPPGVAERAFPAPSRPVAAIVSSIWSDEDARDDAREAENVFSALKIDSGMSVADIGAGGGYYTVRLSQRLGPKGRVYAEDIMPRYLSELRDRVRREHLSNVTIALGDPHDPRLPEKSVDVALLIHMYHEIEQPFGLLYNLHRSLRPGARIAVVDLDRPTRQHGTPPRLLRCEFEAVGYQQIAFQRMTDNEYLAVFASPARPADLVAPDSIGARFAAGPCRGRAP
jgi:SAM-dependent methyltransferase